MATGLRKTGIGVVGDMPWGTHFCHFYETKEDLFDTLVPYFKAGLEDNEFCVWVISEPLAKEEAWNALRQAVPDLDRYVSERSIEMFVGREWYLQGGTFDLHRVMSAWNEKLGQALSRGYAGMRVSGDTFWLEKKDWKDFCEYEKQLNDSITDQLMTVLCTYPLASSGAAEILDVARTHQFALARRSGNWEVIETPEIRQAKEEIKRLNEALEHRVVERTEQLTAVNKELMKEITERKQAEGLMRDANERVEMILDSITGNFFGLSEDWRFTYLNKHAQDQMKFLGKNPASLIGRVLWEEFPDVPNEAALRRVMTERVAITDELYYPPLREWVENHMYPSHGGGIATFQRYVTERKQAEEKLRRSETYLAEGQRLNHTGSWAWDAFTNELFWSQEHFRIVGLDPETTKPSYPLSLQVVHPEDRPFVQQTFDSAIRERSDFELDCRIVRPDGTIRYIHSFAYPVFNEAGDLTEYVGTIIDTTERKRAAEALHSAQAELAHVTRVTTLGELTASIAHEVNQPLGAIVTNGNACLRFLSGDALDLDEAREAVQSMIGDAIRASEVVKHIRTLLKKTVFEKAPLKINETIREVLALTASELARNQVSSRTELAADLPLVLGDRVQLQQVVLNLILNSNEAMRREGCQPRELLISSQQSQTGEVMVMVRDSGIGLDPQDGERIFDAFFTTKMNDGGLGLGLSISRTIIESHGGRLWATANEDQGTTLQFTLPTSGESQS